MADPDIVKNEEPPATPTSKRAREDSDSSSPMELDDDESSMSSDADDVDSTKPDVAAPAYDPNFPNVHARLVTLAEQVIGMVEANGCEIMYEDAIYGTYRRAHELRKAPAVEKTRALLIGDSGVGKSSLINALLGVPKLAKVLAIGKSVTAVATSYESPLEGQVKKYGVHIDYISKEEVVSLIKHFINDYDIYTSDLTEFDADDRNRIERAGKTAVEALNHLFVGTIKFESTSTLSVFLESQKCTFDELVDKLATKAESMIQQLAMRGCRSTSCIQHDGLKDIQDEIVAHTSFIPGQREPSAYPLIKQVRMGIRDNELLKHFSIVDCPGKSDINTIHANASQKQVDGCDELWIVDRTDRIETSGPVADLTRQFGKSSKNVVIIGTRADDDIGDGEALLVHLQEENVEVSHLHQLGEEKAELQRLHKQADRDLTKAQKHVQKSSKRRKSGHTSSSRQDEDNGIARKQNRCFRAKKDVEEVESRYLTALVEARSMQITRSLHERFQDNLAPGKKMEIFFVSNTHYEKIVNGDKSHTLISREATQIPALRRYVHGKVAPKILEATETHISQFSLLIHGIGMFVDPVKLKGSQQAIEMLDTRQQLLPQVCDAYLEDLISRTKSVLIEPLIDDRPAQIDHALGELEKRGKWRQGTVKVWVQGDGKAVTKTKAEESWNEIFSGAAVATIGQRWDHFVGEAYKAADVYHQDLVDSVRASVHEIQQGTLGQLVQIDRFVNFVEACIDGLRAARRTFRNKIRKDLDNVYQRVNTDSGENYFRTGLLEAYEKCKPMTGKGSRDLMINVLRTFLSMQNEASPFAVMTSEMLKHIMYQAEKRAGTFQMAAERIFDDMRAEVTAMLEKRQEDAKEVALRVKLQKWLPDGEKEFEYAKTTLEIIKRDHAGVKQEV